MRFSMRGDKGLSRALLPAFSPATAISCAAKSAGISERRVRETLLHLVRLSSRTWTDGWRGTDHRRLRSAPPGNILVCVWCADALATDQGAH